MLLGNCGEGNMSMKEFFKGKTVLVTGHTGFKGSWLSIWLNEMGANVIGYALEPPYNGCLFELANLDKKITSIIADTRDLKTMDSVFEKYNPDIVIHLAAQALVRLSYDIPRETFETNIMGTINVLECLKKYDIKSAILITSDKCYRNVEKNEGYVETDRMSDQDPYSCSKGCAEMVIESYRKSFGLKIASTRAGNVVGGGDWAKDRLIPDIINSLKENKDIIIRSPNAIRPWQFVLEPLMGYLMLAQQQYEGKEMSSGWNFGPDAESRIPVKDIVASMISKWGSGTMVIQQDKSNKHEATLLHLDCTKSKTQLGWKPYIDIQKTISYIVDWYQNFENEDPYDLCVKQIGQFEAEK